MVPFCVMTHKAHSFYDTFRVVAATLFDVYVGRWLPYYYTNYSLTKSLLQPLLACAIFQKIEKRIP